MVKKLGRSGFILRGKVSEFTGLSGDAVIIFLRNSRPDNGPDSDIFKRASELFSGEQLVEVTASLPRPRPRPGARAPPEVEKARLRGEKKADVPVYDSCDEVRAKIAAYLGRPDSPTPHYFCDMLHTLLKVTVSKGFETTQLRDFMAKEGPEAGAGALLYYAAYIFFEKLRIAEGRPKSDHRLEMERLHPHGLKCTRR